jgi:signal transduction histidine kinase
MCTQGPKTLWAGVKSVDINVMAQAVLSQSMRRGESVVDFADVASTFHLVRAFTAASSAAALAVFASSWDFRSGTWLAIALALAATADALWQRKRGRSRPVLRLAFDAAVLSVAVIVIGGPALIAGPFAYLLAAALMVLPLQRALLMIGYFAAWIAAVYFSAVTTEEGPTRLFLSLGAAFIFLTALSVVLLVVGGAVQQARARQKVVLGDAIEDSRARTQMLANVGHELRTPLTAVVGFSQVLRDGNLPKEEVDELISALAREAFDLSGIVDDLLVAARDQIGELSVIAVTVNARAQIAQVLEGWEQSVGQQIEVDSSSDARAVADPARLRQVVRNLLTNALRYGGESVRIEVDESADCVYVRVCDNGGGIPKDRWESIFEPYERENGVDQQPASVGLGLAVSRQLARRMGGDLTYFHNGESVFELTLPKASPKAAE